MSGKKVKTIEEIKNELLEKTEKCEQITQDEVMKQLEDLNLTDDQQDSFMEWARDNGVIMEEELAEEILEEDEVLQPKRLVPKQPVIIKAKVIVEINFFFFIINPHF